MSITVVGSVALDTVKTPFGKKKDILGGSATYFSVSARFFSPVNLVAVIGGDFPRRHINFLKKKGIDLKGLEVAKGKSFRWEGEYGWDFSDPRTVATHLNVFSNFNPKIPPEYKNTRSIFLANIDPRIQNHVLNQIAKPKVVACDTMDYWIDNRRKTLVNFLRRVDIFFLNESEARKLTDESSLVKAAGVIQRFGAKNVIIKKGEHGSLLFSDRSIFSTPAYLLESIVDPTGAGDTFAGGVMGYLASKKNLNQTNLRKAIVYGSVMATFAVEDFSLKRLAAIGKSDIIKRLREFKKQTRF